MNKIIIATFKWCVILGLAFSSKVALADNFSTAWSSQAPAAREVRFEFTGSRLAGFETDRLQNRLQTIKVRGWRMSKNSYFGQTRVAHRTDFGFVFQNGNTVYQINNRGVQVTRYF